MYGQLEAFRLCRSLRPAPCLLFQLDCTVRAKQGNAQRKLLTRRAILPFDAATRASHNRVRPRSRFLQRPINNYLTSKYPVADEARFAVSSSPVSSSHRNFSGRTMDEKYCIYDKIGVLFEELVDVTSENRQYFSRRKRTVDLNYVETFDKILNVIEPLKVTIQELTKICSKYDVDHETKGNGFRSLICVTEKCLFKILELSVYVQKSRDRFFFRAYHYFMEVDSYSQVISRLFTVMQVTLSLGTYLDGDSLFVDEDKFPEEVDGLMNDFETVGRECFYGRSFGFQFSPAMRQSINVIAVAHAAYGDGFKRHNGNTARALSSVIHSGKYLVDPELRAKRIVELTQHVSMPFCKSFWSITESYGIQHVPMLICPAVAVNKELKIDVKPLFLHTQNMTKVIDPQFASQKPKKIFARLISYVQREGQGKAGSSDSLAGAFGRRTHGLSKNLVLHCHGGGFVAQSSKSHEIYLRNWAKELECPILSIDYSLAPDAPYPEALNECFYAYAWAMINCKSLGWTGDSVCFAGDSAGANLMVALTLKLIQEDVRLPDGLVVAYPPFRVQYAPSPSRMLALMDPLLPPGVLKACLRAYAGNMHGDTINDTGSFSSIRTPVFEDFYNPFDVDLGEVAYASRIRNVNDLVGKRSYSDSNLVTRGKHYMPMRAAGLRNGRERNSNTEYRSVQDRIDSETDADEDGLHMHQIPCDQHDVPGQKMLKETGSKDKICEESQLQNGDIFSDSYKQNHTLCSETTDLDNINAAADNEELTQSFNTVADKEFSENIHVNSANEKDHVVLRRTRSKTIPHHRRSRSDTIAESFQRLRPNSGDFSVARTLSDHNTEEQNQHTLFDETDISLTSTAQDIANLELIDKQNNTMRKKESPGRSFSKKDEFTAIYMKETSDCVILDRDSGEISQSSCTSTFEKIEKVYERNDSSNSISSSVKQRSRDPLMSPLLASDDLLKKLPKLIIVACSLDPLLDDSVDFIRRLKQLQTNAELFIVDDLPHGFLNLNFASSEAKEACELISACIKRVLNVGFKHENSFPLSPEAAKEEIDNTS